MKVPRLEPAKAVATARHCLATRGVRLLLLLLAPLTLVSCGLGNNREDAAMKNLRDEVQGKNLVLVLLDAAAYGHFGYAGYDRNTTPNVDALAEKSLVFDTAYTEASSTGPSVYAMFTSSYPFLAERQGLKGIRDAPFKIDEHTAVDAGASGAEVPTASCVLFERLDRTRVRFRSRLHSVPRDLRQRSGARFDRTSRRSYRRCVQDRIEFVGKRSQSSRTSIFWNRIPRTNPPGHSRASSIRSRRIASTPALRVSCAIVSIPPSQRRQKMIRALYDGNLAYVDSKARGSDRGSEESGHWNDTVFLVIADHGEAFWQHGVYEHGHHIYEEFVRIPFIVHVPGRSRTHGPPHQAAGFLGRSLAHLPGSLRDYSTGQPEGRQFASSHRGCYQGLRDA